MEQQIALPSEQATIDTAAQMAKTLPKGSIILLYGDLGAGKTCFARAFIRQWMGDPNLPVPSPTFTLVQDYTSVQGVILHMDLYRLEDADDIHELGWEDVLSKDVTALIEWPQRLGRYVPQNAISCTFETDGDGRILMVKGLSA